LISGGISEKLIELRPAYEMTDAAALVASASA